VRPLPGDLLDRLRSGGRDLTILVVRLGALGDVLRTVPPVRLIRAALPEAVILWTVDDRWACMLEGHADLNAVFPLPRESWARGGKHGSPSIVPRFSTSPDGFAGSART
jgi:hypothetical protein